MNMKTFRLLIILALISLTNVCEAQIVDETSARITGIDFLDAKKVEKASTNSVNKAPAHNYYELAYTATKHGKVCFYVYNCSTGGFVIVSADNRTERPVLGYSTEGVFNIEEIPENVKSWIDGYARQIFKADSCGYKKISSTSKKTTRSASSVEPLLETKWDQGYPFNILCPKIGDEYCLTGCVPTAVAQVMKYNNWPEHGSGLFYMPDNNQTVDISQSTYEWEIMSGNYTDINTTQESKNAVATIMRDVGLASGSNYGISATSTMTQNAAIALANNFDYDRSIQFIARDYISNEDWIYELKSELDDGRPCVNDGGIHCFVCDGYDVDDYFHYNFGWGGALDGYYLTEAVLDFSEGQSLIKGIKKNFGGKPWHQGYSANDFLWRDGIIYYSISMISAPGIENVNDYDLVYILENEETGEIICPTSLDNLGYKISYATTGCFTEEDFFRGFKYSEIKNGKYKIYPCTVNKRDTTDIKKVLFMDNVQSYITLIIDGDERTFINHPNTTPGEGRIYHDGLYYILDKDKKTAAVSNKSDKTPCYVGDITIPRNIEYEGYDYKVTSINRIAFAGCKNLKSIFIPQTVERIDTSAFAASSVLNVIFEENSSIKDIDYCAFYNCRELDDIYLPSEIKRIGSRAFGNCVNLKEINIPSSVEIIENGAFYLDNGNLRDVTVNWLNPKNFPHAFIWGSIPVTLHVPEGTSDNYREFACWNKFNIVEGYSTKLVLDGLYYDVYPLSNTATVAGYDPNFDFNNYIEIPNNVIVNNTDCSVSEIGSSSFYGCDVENIRIPLNVEIIGANAFEESHIKFAEIENGSKLHTLSGQAFIYSDLKEINLPVGLKEIGGNCFWGSNLSSIEIPESVERIGLNAFPYHLAEFKAITVYWNHPQNLGFLSTEDRQDLIMYVPIGTKTSYDTLSCWNFLTIKEGRFSKIRTDIEDISYELTYPELEATVISKIDGEYTGDITIPSKVEYNGDEFSVTTIGEKAFNGCNIYNVIIPGSVKKIIKRAFYGSSISSIEISTPSELWHIGMYAFYSSTLSSIKLPISLTTIGHAAFAETLLSEINIPLSVKEFEGSIQFIIPSLKSVYANWEEPLKCDYETFGEIEEVKEKTLYVPLGTKDKYSLCAPWSWFGKIIESENLLVDETMMPTNLQYPCDIYNINGALIKRNATETDIEHLIEGFYIINGRKVLVPKVR